MIVQSKTLILRYINLNIQVKQVKEKQIKIEELQKSINIKQVEKKTLNSTVEESNSRYQNVVKENDQLRHSISELETKRFEVENLKKELEYSIVN